MTDRLVIGISGASGVVYGVRLLELLADSAVETHLVMTPSAEVTLAHETDRKAATVKALADRVYNPRDIAAAIASGSFRTRGMVVAPCSVRSLSEIAWGTTTNLLTRAADVTLKERRRLVLLVRETPLHTAICAPWRRQARTAPSSCRRSRPSTPARRTSAR